MPPVGLQPLHFTLLIDRIDIILNHTRPLDVSFNFFISRFTGCLSSTLCENKLFYKYSERHKLMSKLSNLGLPMF